MPIVCTAEEAVSMIRPVDTMGFGLGPANPDTFLTALGARDDWQDLQVGGALCLNFYEVFTKHGVTYRCGFFGPAERTMLAQGANIDLVPGGFRQFAPILRRFAPRVMTAQAAPPDAAHVAMPMRFQSSHSRSSFGMTARAATMSSILPA